MTIKSRSAGRICFPLICFVVLFVFKCVEVQAGGALIEEIKPTDIFPGYRLECYPNRDSTKYGKLYDITTANTILRGTLRYEVQNNAGIVWR